jgi:uncharacterized membrane protein
MVSGHGKLPLPSPVLPERRDAKGGAGGGMRERRIHQIFEAGMLLKGLHGLVECIGGLTLTAISAHAVIHLVGLLTQGELAEDPHDVIATHLMLWADHFSGGSKTFFALYLLSHGLTKIVLVVALLRGKLWAYPASLTVLGLFILYQLYRFLLLPGPGMILLTIFDLGVMWLIWHEYRVMQRHGLRAVRPDRFRLNRASESSEP